jgi:hypothetical protein
MSTKDHFRKVFKSDHLGSADLEEFTEDGKPLIFTIREVKQEYGAKVAGKKIDANIAYFIEPIKPLVLNATNSRTVKKLAGGSPFVQDWSNITIELYVDASVRMKGEVVGGVRIKEEAPKVLNESDIKIVIDQVSKCKDLKDLTALYNSDIKYRTNKSIVDAFSAKGTELKAVK